jgi:hypothetical protein
MLNVQSQAAPGEEGTEEKEESLNNPMKGQASKLEAEDLKQWHSHVDFETILPQHILSMKKWQKQE